MDLYVVFVINVCDKRDLIGIYSSKELAEECTKRDTSSCYAIEEYTLDY